MTEPTTEQKLDRCRKLFADLLRAAYDETKPVDRELVKGAAECGAYLLSLGDGEPSDLAKEFVKRYDATK